MLIELWYFSMNLEWNQKPLLWSTTSYIILSFQIAFATNALSPFASITVALGGIHQVSSYLQVFVLLFSLPLTLFIQIVTGLTSPTSVSHQFKYSLWKGFACPLFKVIHLSPWFILLVAAITGIILYIYVSTSCLSHWSPWFEGQEAGSCLLLCSMTGSKWSTKCVKLNWTVNHILISWDYMLLEKLWVSKSTITVILKSEDRRIRPT